MTHLTPEQDADLEAFLNDQLADLGLDPSEEARLRQRIRQLAVDDLRGTGPLARGPRPAPAMPRHAAV